MKRPLRPDLTVVIDGEGVPAVSGQSVLAVLVAAGRASRPHPVTGRPEAPSCGMGTCLACDVHIEGRGTVRACGQEVADGMRVRTVLS